MTDDLTPAEGDTPGPFATPAQDADVRALLGTLRAEDVPMPDDVVRRINAAVVAERVASTLPDSPAALVDADPTATTATGSATVTVLPSAEKRRGGSGGGLKRLLALAAAVVVVLAGGAAIKSVGLLAGGGNATSAGAAASQAPEATDMGGGSAGGDGATPLASGKVTTSGTNYSAEGLALQALSLAQGATPTTAPIAPVPSGSPVEATRSSAYAAPAGAVLDACVTALTGRAGVAPIAVDSGTYGGRPALVLVLPTEGDAQSLDVWVVAPGCGTGGEPDLITFQRIARP